MQRVVISKYNSINDPSELKQCLCKGNKDYELTVTMEGQILWTKAFLQSGGISLGPSGMRRLQAGKQCIELFRNNT